MEEAGTDTIEGQSLSATRGTVPPQQDGSSLRRQVVKMLWMIATGGVFLSGFAWAALHKIQEGPRPPEENEKDCPLCREQARIAKEHDAGRMSNRDWVDRRIALLEGEYLTNRLALLEEKGKLLDAESKPGKDSKGDFFDTKLEIGGLNYALKKIDEKQWKSHREELVSPYRTWLNEQHRAGKLTQEEFKKRMSALETP